MPLIHSPFAEKLHSNYVPSDAELDQLHVLLVGPKNELALIDIQIDKMEVALDQLKAKRGSLKAEIDAHQALMSPLRRAPQEILQEIFLACLPTANNALIDPGEAPMLLGRICRLWRSVAYSTPMLWSSLHIPPLMERWNSEMPPQVEDRLEKFVEAWLDRSGGCPLSISLSRFPYTYNVAANLVLPGTVHQLIRVAPRLRHLSICAHTSEMRQLLFFDAKDLPCLESVHIQSPLDLNDRWEEAPILQLPSLRQISLHISADALALPLRWSELTDLDLECFPTWMDVPIGSVGDPGGLDQNGAMELLRRCPNLVRCHLHATTGVPFIAGPTITLPHLKALSLSGEIDSFRFMQFLVSPGLRYLFVGADGSNPSLRSVESSAHELTLELTNQCRLPEGGLLDLFALLPGLSRVRLVRCSRVRLPNNNMALIDLDDGFLTRLSPDPENTLCPALSHIELGICSFSDAALLAFIRARMATDHPLQRLEATLPGEAGVDFTSALREFPGLSVELRSQRPKWDLDPREGLGETETSGNLERVPGREKMCGDIQTLGSRSSGLTRLSWPVAVGGLAVFLSCGVTPHYNRNHLSNTKG
ncbi:hypothetical protein DFH09DRAFT_1275055 [Mycena vulgaris]|nr:hypothetical protein DFH09DRAFT_1275055 [Mycena vulgaris]